MTELSMLEYPQLQGALYTIGGFERTPFVFLMGAVGSARTRYIGQLDFVEGVDWSVSAGSLGNLRSEAQSFAGPPAFTPTVRTAHVNTCCFFDYPVQITEQAIAAARAVDVSITQNRVDLTQYDMPTQNLLQFEVSKAVLQAATDYEHLCLSGTYNQALIKTDVAQAGGLLELTENLAFDMAGAEIDRDHFEEALKELYDVGGIGGNQILFVGARNKQILSKLYGYAPSDRNIGGVNIKQLEVDLIGNLPVVVVPKLSTDMLIVNMDAVRPVAWPMPRGVLYYQELPSPGTGINAHIYGCLGIDRGLESMHKKIKGCKV